MLGDHAATGHLEVLSSSGLFRSTRQPLLLADPVLLDGVGQLIGLWAMEQGVYVFPISIRRLEIYRPTPAAGTRVPVSLNISQFSHRFLSADIELQDGEGGVWMRIQGWQDWVFHWTQNLFDFRRDPTRHCLSNPLQLPGMSGNAIATQVDSGEFRDMESEVLARFYLHAEELRQFNGLAGIPLRQKQWLLGRIAAKDAVRRWLRGDGNEPMIHPAAFIIAQDELRRPFVSGLSTPVPHISIAHSGERAVAIAHANNVGIDLEPVEPRASGLLASILTTVEAGRLEAVPNAERDEMATRIWCAKETAGKAWGTGINSPKSYETNPLSRGRDFLVIHQDSGSRLVVTTHRDDGYIIAYALTGSNDDSSQGPAPLEKEAACGIG
jgi:phosphopantetheinyl transferase